MNKHPNTVGLALGRIAARKHGQWRTPLYYIWGVSYPAQLAFLSKLDGTAFPPNTVFIFTCNAVENLEARFLSRCRRIDFSSYGLAEGIKGLLERIWDAETDSPDERPNFARIAKESNNNVRDALMTLEVQIMGA